MKHKERLEAFKRLKNLLTATTQEEYEEMNRFIEENSSDVPKVDEVLKGNKHKMFYHNLTKNLVYSTSGKRLKLLFVLLLIVWLLSSCRLTRENCEQEFGPCGHITPLEIVTTVKDTTYITKGDTVTQTFFARKTDTITVEKFVEKFKSKLKTNADSRISLIWSNDSVLHIRAICPPDTIVVEKAVVKTVKTQEKKVLVEKPVSWWDVIKYVVIGIFIGMILFLVFNLIRKLLVWYLY